MWMHSAEEPTPLTTSQKSRVRREFREAYLMKDEAQRNHAIAHVYFKFEEMYGIPRDEIREIVEKVKREHRSEMHGPKPPKANVAPPKPPKAKVARPKPKRQPMTRWPLDPEVQRPPVLERQTPKKGKVASLRPKQKKNKAIEEYQRSTSVRTVSGGLPGLGKRS